MKTFYFLLVTLLIQLNLFAQGSGTYRDFTIQVDDQPRKFKLYTPPGIDPSEPAPLVLVFHGFGGTSLSMVLLSEFYQVADTAGFYVVYPQGALTTDGLFGLGTNYGWEVPFFTSNSVDDIAFVEEMIDTIIKDPNLMIDENRIYSTGFSNGACFSFYLGCILSERLAAVSGVAGAIPLSLMDTGCTPSRKISSLQMFGTNDAFVPLLPPHFGSLLTTSIFWAGQNNCSLTATIEPLPNKDLTDGSTVTLLEYPDCSGNLEVLFYRINNGQHNWPGGQDIPNAIVNFDIDASDEIWKFFSRHSLNEQTVATKDAEKSNNISVFPNPFIDEIQIKLFSNVAGKANLNFYDVSGDLAFNKWVEIQQGENIVSVAISSPTGFYTLLITTEDGRIFQQKILKL